MSGTITVSVPGGMVVEQTGGGNTALVRHLLHGRVLVIADGNLSHELLSGDVSLLLFAHRQDWEDGGEPVAVETVDGEPTEVEVDPLTARFERIEDAPVFVCEDCGTRVSTVREPRSTGHRAARCIGD